MAELVKQWDDGGSLSVTYDGNGDGSAVFTSEINEGLDRETDVKFADRERVISIRRKVTQIGMRERFITSDDEVFAVTDGVYGVLKEGADN